VSRDDGGSPNVPALRSGVSAPRSGWPSEWVRSASRSLPAVRGCSLDRSGLNSARPALAGCGRDRSRSAPRISASWARGLRASSPGFGPVTKMIGPLPAIGATSVAKAVHGRSDKKPSQELARSLEGLASPGRQDRRSRVGTCRGGGLGPSHRQTDGCRPADDAVLEHGDATS